MSTSAGADRSTSDNAHPVIVGIDGSDSSCHAARGAAGLAHALRVPLHLVHSVVTVGSYLSDAAVIAIKAATAADQYTAEAAEKILTATVEAVHHEFPELSVTTEVAAEPADTALIQQSRQARFVVLGCEDISRAAALLLGSTSLAVTTRARCPVVAWRGIAAPTTAPVVVGVDGTPAGTAALAAAFAFADQFGARVKAVHAWSTTMPADYATLPYLIDWEAAEREQHAVLASAVRPWAERFPGVEVEFFLDPVKPSRALLDRLEDAQLVVVGTHRTNALTAAILGSTTLNMLHHSAVPVLVCHAADAS